MNTYAAVRRLDGTKQVFQVNDCEDLDDAFAVLKRDVPNVRVCLVLVSSKKEQKK